MQIGKDWKIESDSLNVTLQKRASNSKTGRDYWRVDGYFSNVKNALHALVDIGINETGLKELKTVNKRIDEIHNLIDKALKSPGTTTRNVTSPKEATEPQSKGK